MLDVILPPRNRAARIDDGLFREATQRVTVWVGQGIEGNYCRTRSSCTSFGTQGRSKLKRASSSVQTGDGMKHPPSGWRNGTVYSSYN